MHGRRVTGGLRPRSSGARPIDVPEEDLVRAAQWLRIHIKFGPSTRDAPPALR
jgi:hypothetical protein